MAITFTKANSEYLDSASPPITAAPFSVSIWGRFTSGHTSDGEYETLWSIVDESETSRYVKLQRDHDAPTLIFVIATGAGIGVAQGSTSITVNQWGNAICVAASTSDRKVWWDNTGEGVNTLDSTLSGIDAWDVGREGDSTPDDYMEGQIAEVAVWNRALTAVERAGLAAGFSALFYLEGLVRYIPMFGNTSGPEPCWVSTDSLTHQATPTLSANHPRIIYPSSPIFIPVAAGAPPGANPHGPLGHPLHGPFAGPIN